MAAEGVPSSCSDAFTVGDIGAEGLGDDDGDVGAGAGAAVGCNLS